MTRWLMNLWLLLEIANESSFDLPVVWIYPSYAPWNWFGTSDLFTFPPFHQSRHGSAPWSWFGTNDLWSPSLLSTRAGIVGTESIELSVWTWDLNLFVTFFINVCQPDLAPMGYKKCRLFLSHRNCLLRGNIYATRKTPR